MEQLVDNATVQYREHQRRAGRALGFSRILPINVETFPEGAIEELWKGVQQADYAFEDSTRGDLVAFAKGMLAPGTYNFEIPGDVFAQVVGADKGSNAVIHFLTLRKELPVAPMISAAEEVFRFAFDRVGIHRMTAYVPSFNEKVIRMAALIRMKFEGSMRKSFLYNDEWWDLQIYGLLENEWRRREN